LGVALCINCVLFTSLSLSLSFLSWDNGVWVVKDCVVGFGEYGIVLEMFRCIGIM
jgi:hypothetical protein